MRKQPIVQTTERVRQGLAAIDHHLPNVHSLLLLGLSCSALIDKMRIEKCPLVLVAWNSLGPWDNGLRSREHTEKHELGE